MENFFRKFAKFNKTLKKRTFLFTVLSGFSFLISSCNTSRYVDYFPYYDDGIPKPRVAILPIIDHSGLDLPWQLSEELSHTFYYGFMDSGELYLLAPEEMEGLWSKEMTQEVLRSSIPRSSPVPGVDFLAAIEVVEHSEDKCQNKQRTPYTYYYPGDRVLTIKLRVKVIDVRETPKIVLYETLETSLVLNANHKQLDYSKISWGTPQYSMTPYAQLHQRIVKELGPRLEGVIWSAR